MSLVIDDSAVKRIQELRTQQGKESLMLRITVDSGGCSGFQYLRELTEDIKDKDLKFADCVVTDDISMAYLEGATIGFKDDLIGSDFTIENPNAASGCGCGTSFAV
ncbi:MAG: iron-sulfur cluster assembly accessory protein [Pseudomonadota bacterium]